MILRFLRHAVRYKGHVLSDRLKKKENNNEIEWDAGELYIWEKPSTEYTESNRVTYTQSPYISPKPIAKFKIEAHGPYPSSIRVKCGNSLVSLSGAFSDLYPTTSIDLKEMDTSNVTDFSYMFNKCYLLKDLTTSNFNTSKATNMEEMFCFTTEIPSMNLSSFDTTKVMNMSKMFKHCYAYTLDISNFKINENTDTTDMFNYCPNLEKVYVDNCDEYTLTRLEAELDKAGAAMKENYDYYLTTDENGRKILSRREAQIGDYVEWEGKNDTDSMLIGKKINPNNSSSYLDVDAYSSPYTSETPSLVRFKFLPRTNTDEDNNITSVIVKGCSEVQSLEFTFFNLKALTSIDLKEMNTSKLVDMNSTFYGCSSLTTIDLSNFDTSNVTTYRELFGGCNNLTTIYVDNCNEATINGLMGALKSTLSTVSFEIGSIDGRKAIVKSLPCEDYVEWNDGAIDGYCIDPYNHDDTTYFYADSTQSPYNPSTNITELTFKGNPTSVTIKGGSKIENLSTLFDGKNTLTSVNLKEMNTSNAKYMAAMFKGCSSLTTLDLSSFDTSNVTDINEMFKGCSSLTSIDLTSCDFSNVNQDCFGLFEDCSSLTSIDLSHTTITTEVMYEAFNGCSSLKTIHLKNLPDLDYDILENTFIGCKNLETIYIDSYAKNNSDNEQFVIECLQYTLNRLDTQGKYYFEINYLDDGKVSLNRVANTNIHHDYFTYTMDDDSELSLKCYYSGNYEMNSEKIKGSSPITTPYPLYTFNIDNVHLTSLKIVGGHELKTLNTSLSYLENLTELDLTELNTSNVTNMRNIFRDCSSLTTLDLSNFDTSKVTVMESMFSGCTSLTSLDLSNFDTSNVTNMMYMFRVCSSLTTLDLSNFDTSNVTNMMYMFRYCSSLTTLDLSNFDLTNCENCSYMFHYCNDLTTIYVDNCNETTISKLMEALTESLPDTSFTVSTRNNRKAIIKSDGNNGGDGSDGETKYTGDYIEWTDADAYAVIAEKDGTTPIEPPTTTQSPYKNKNPSISVLSFASAMKPKIYTIKIKGCPKLEDFDFRDLNNLTDVDLSEMNCSSYKNEVMAGAFSWLESLENINFSNFDTSKITTMASTFRNCYSLTELDLSSFDTSRVTDMSEMFLECNSLTTLDLSSFDTSNVTTMEDMFNDCYKLETLDLSSFDTSNVTNMTRMFGECQSLTSLDLSNFDTSNVTNMSCMFGFNDEPSSSQLTTLDLSNFDLTNCEDFEYMFLGCYRLITIYVDHCNDDTISKFKEDLARSLSNGSYFTLSEVNGRKALVNTNPY